MPRFPFRHAASSVLCATAVAAAAVALPTSAATVTGAYQGVIGQDSGLGLIGQIMTVSFAYDDNAVPASTSGNEYAFYPSFLQSMQVSIGSHAWQWIPAEGGASLFIYDNSVQSFAIGVEDAVTAFAYDFSGPTLVAEPVSSQSYAFALYLSDVTPLGTPDAIDGIVPLPSVVPDPTLFNNGEGRNVMTFSFFTGNPEFGGSYYSIVTTDVTAVPEPATTGLMALGLVVVGAGACRLSRARKSLAV